MRHIGKKMTCNSSMVDRLDQIRMSKEDLALAKASMRQAELIADLVEWVWKGFRWAVTSPTRGASSDRRGLETTDLDSAR